MRIFLWLIIVLPAAAFSQNSYTVSNVAGTSANFRTLQGAHDSVPAGSVLYLLPSAQSYGVGVFTKKLTVYGTGYFLGANLAPNTQANAGAVIVQSITFRPGSDNSYIEGLQLTDLTNDGQQLTRIYMDTVSNVVVSRCLFTPGYSSNASFLWFNTVSNAIVRQCYFSSMGRGLSSVIGMYGVVNGFSGCRFDNNIFDFLSGGIDGYRMLTGRAPGVSADATFTNNTICTSLYRSTFGDFNYTNNIFVNVAGTADYNSPVNTQLTGINLNNVIAAPAVLTSPGNNAEGANTDSMFVGSQAGYHSTDQQWMLRSGNFANTFGVGGIACGAFGGDNPYRLSGIPSIPYIYSLNVPNQATAPGTISVHIKARASN